LTRAYWPSGFRSNRLHGPLSRGTDTGAAPIWPILSLDKLG
jgi:hypothetical protein